MNRIAQAAWLVAGSGLAFAGELTLVTPSEGDAQYSWNSRYGPYGYEVGGTAIGVGLSMGGSYGNDWTIGIVEVPIAPLAGHDLSSATLFLTSLGFGTGYYYGSARLNWQNFNGATGDVVADGRGAFGIGDYVADLWKSDWPHDGSGLRQFDVLQQVLSDLAAGRTYSTFTLSGSRDTFGGVVTAEGGAGPYLIATGETLVPEPAATTAISLAAGAMLLRRRRSPR